MGPQVSPLNSTCRSFAACRVDPRGRPGMSADVGGRLFFGVSVRTGSRVAINRLFKVVLVLSGASAFRD